MKKLEGERSMKIGMFLVLLISSIFLIGWILYKPTFDNRDLFALIAVACGGAGSIYNGARKSIRQLQARIAELEGAQPSE